MMSPLKLVASDFVLPEKYNENIQKPLFCKVFDKHILVSVGGNKLNKKNKSHL